jgi:hypothetical protein
MTDKPKKAPSERDQRIYWEVRGRFRTQRDVAKEFELTQPRVCQIVRDVAAHFAQTMPGLDLRLSRADELALVSRECIERRQRLFARAEEEYEASKRPLVTTLTMRKDDRGWKQEIERQQRGDVRLLKIMQQENDRLASWAEKQIIANCKVQNAKCKVTDESNLQFAIPALQFAMKSDGKSTRGPGSAGPAEPTWPPNLPTDSPEFVFYPYRSEGEMSACMLAKCVVGGSMTPAEYIQRLEIQELEKPLVSPLALARAEEVGAAGSAAPDLPVDSACTSNVNSPAGAARRSAPTWRIRERDELRPPSPLAQKLLFAGRHAQDLDAATQAEVYQPYLSRAEYYATLRREMLGEGMLSPDEFGSLSLWASQLPGGLPAEGVTEDGRLINTSGATAGLPSSGCAAPPIANCEMQTANCKVEDGDNLQFAIPTLQFAMEPAAGRSTAGPTSSGTHSPITRTTGRGFEGTTRERLLAAGKPLSDRTRARWERKVERRKERKSLALSQ